MPDARPEADAVHMQQPDHTPLSTQSLRDLRRELVEQAAMAATRARVARARGDLRTARGLEQRASKLLGAARCVDVPDRGEG